MDGDRESYGGYSVDDENQLDPLDTLDSSDLVDELDRGFIPPDRYSSGQGYGTTAWEAVHARPLADRLAEEIPEPNPAEEAAVERGDAQESDAFDDEVGLRRAGRLVAPDLGLGADDEAEALASDVGLSGAAASAEEAAVHVIDRDRA
jgi:hypothetical protein